MRIRRSWLAVAALVCLCAPAPARSQASGLSLDESSAAVPAWQLAAVHEDAVPGWVRAGAASVTIAIVDTGADLSVPSLASTPATTWNVLTGLEAVSDNVGHGTFVASLAAGADIGFGGAAHLLVVQANRGGMSFEDPDEAAAIVWAVDHGADIVNLSFAGADTSPDEQAAIRYAIDRGVLLVAAAGNAAQQGNPTVYPAALIGRDGLVVGAADAAGRRAAFSSTGPYVDLLAPGVDVLGALPPVFGAGLFTRVPAPRRLGTLGLGTGTSFAAPEVAGAAALVMAANPSLDARAVAATLEQTASDGGRWSPARGFGELDVAAAVDRALASAVSTAAVGSSPG